MPFSLGIVDDDEGVLYTLKAMAESLGWLLKTTGDPMEALGWLQEDLVDLLMVDYHMPIMSGLEVIRQGRQMGSRAILLALTVEEDTEVARQLLLAGADDFISKPIRLADFSSRIRLHLELLRFRKDFHWENRSKGLSEETSRRVYELFSEDRSMTASEAAECSGLAYPTVHRYLEHLVKKGQLQRKNLTADGRSGRPRILYSKSDNDRRNNDGIENP